MKKIILAFLFLVAYVTLYADNNNNYVRQEKARLFGLTIGYSQPSFYEKEALLSANTTTKYETNHFHSFLAGLTINPEFGSGLGILTGVQYNLVPTAQRVGKPQDYIKKSIIMHDIMVPLRIQYRYEFTPAFSLFAYTGPSLGVGLSFEKTTQTYKEEKLVETLKENLYNDSAEKIYSRFHTFWGIGFGIILNQHFRIEYFADWGLNNITPYSHRATRFNKIANVALSYMF